MTDAAAGPLTEHAIRRLWMHTRMAHKLLEVRELYKTADLAEHVLIAQQMQGILQERIRRLEEFQHRLKTVQVRLPASCTQRQAPPARGSTRLPSRGARTRLATASLPVAKPSKRPTPSSTSTRRRRRGAWTR